MSDYHIDQALTGYAVELGGGGPFVADRIYPVVPVSKTSDKFWTFEKALGEHVDDLMADMTKAKVLQWKHSTDTYSCEQRALRRFLSDIKINDMDEFHRKNWEKNTVKRLMNQLRLNLEHRVKDVVFSSTYITNYSTPTTKWDGSSPTIEKNIDTAKESVAVKSGHEPNTVLIPRAIANVMKNDSTILDKVKYTDPSLLINGDLPPVLFGLNVIIPGAIQNSANPGQSQSLARVWSDENVLVCYVDPEPDAETYTLGSQFRAKHPGASRDEDRFFVRKYRDEETENGGWWIEVGFLNDEKLVASGAGYLLTSVLT